MGQDYSSNPKSPESTGDTEVWAWEERNEKSGWYSVQHASGNREYTRKVLSEQKSAQTRGKHLGNIDQFREDAYSDVDAIYGFINAGSIAHGPDLRKEFEFGITRMMIEGNSEIKNVFPADVASSLSEKHVLLKEQAKNWTKTRVYVYSDSVLCMGNRSVQKMQ